jgi:NDP-4-keto-2,6-dideoxyhexose 3-C-methyltransferase
MELVSRTSCRSCGSRSLTSVLSLGEQFVSTFLDTATDNERVPKAPLELVLCDPAQGGCSLLQLKHSVPVDLMFRQYWYRSGMNRSMTLALEDIASSAERKIQLLKGDMVVDIGCNDGTLLRSFRRPGLRLVGFEPARNLIPFAQVGTTKVINDYFELRAFERQFPGSKAKIITSIAMFYDLENPNSFVRDVKACLNQDGVWIIQMSYLPSMLTQNAFDNVCHEHLEYYSMRSLKGLLSRHDFEVFDVELNDVNGGSFRVYVRHKGSSAVGDSSEGRKRLHEVERMEAQMKLDQTGVYHEFASRVKLICEKLYGFVRSEHEKGKQIYVYGASTKGNTLLQFSKLDYHLIGAAAERNPDKWGKRTVGTLIPIISEERARADKPDYFLVLPWHFVREFKEREKAYLESGGKFIVPLPEFKIVDAST